MLKEAQARRHRTSRTTASATPPVAATAHTVAVPTARRVTGSPRTWAVHLALMGGLTSLIASLPFAPVGFAPVAGVLGVLTGAALGWCAPDLLDRVRGRVRLSVLALLAPVLGAVWGGVVGAGAGAVLLDSTAVMLGLIAGSAAGAAQVAWFWFPYVFQTVRGKAAWPVVVAAVVAAPAMSLVSLVGTMATLSLFDAF